MAFLVVIIILYGLYKKLSIYDVFVEGAKESFSIILTLFPTLLGMVLCINLLVGSGLFDYLFNIIKISFIPVDIIPLMILRPVSGSSTLAILSNILTIVPLPISVPFPIIPLFLKTNVQFCGISTVSPFKSIVVRITMVAPSYNLLDDKLHNDS